MRRIAARPKSPAMRFIDGDARQTELIPVNLAAIRRGDAGADLQLQPYDILVIKPIPHVDGARHYRIAGRSAVPRASIPSTKVKRCLRVLQRAGGFTDAGVSRGRGVHSRGTEKTRKGAARAARESPAKRLGSPVARSGREQCRIANSAAAAAARAQGLAIGQQLMTQLRDTKPVGRLVIDIDRVMKGPAGIVRAMSLLRDGDKLLVPKKSQEITISGRSAKPDLACVRGRLDPRRLHRQERRHDAESGPQADLCRACERRCHFRRTALRLVQAHADLSKCARATPSSYRWIPSG